jgi:2,3-bisphosphoglycerate-dependent phosphoglycerate mutase
MLLLIRHGETTLNANGVLQTPDTPLSDRGQRQAEWVGERMKDFPVSGMACSPLLRAQSTAFAIQKALGASAPPLHQSDLLEERNFGEFRGKPYSVIGGSVLTYEPAPPQGESLQTFKERVASAFLWMLRIGKEQPCFVFVSHGLFIRELIQSHLQGPDAPPIGRIGNTSVTIFSAQAPFSISRLACTAHLPPDLL